MGTPPADNRPTHPSTGQPDKKVDERRRDAMRRLAKYTAPAMLAMLLSDKAFAQNSA